MLVAPTAPPNVTTEEPTVDTRATADPTPDKNDSTIIIVVISICVVVLLASVIITVVVYK